MDFETLLGQLEASRPDLSESLSLLRQYNKQKKEENPEAPTNDDDREGAERLLAVLDKQKTLNKKLLQRYELLENNYALLIEHLDQLADALGACPHCWGEDRDCHRCGGQGRPGHYPPNSRYFDQYVRPVLRRFKKPETIS